MLKPQLEFLFLYENNESIFDSIGQELWADHFVVTCFDPINFEQTFIVPERKKAAKAANFAQENIVIVIGSISQMPLFKSRRLFLLVILWLRKTLRLSWDESWKFFSDKLKNFYIGLI